MNYDINEKFFNHLATALRKAYGVNAAPSAPRQERPWEDLRRYSYSSLGDNYNEANAVSSYAEETPDDVDTYFDHPYPPPDRISTYRPKGTLGEAIQSRLEEEKAERDTITDWWLVERETEVGYSEYTMESDYSYTLVWLVHWERCEKEFDSIAAVIKWIEGES